MITEKDIRAAIAECQGARNPNANTCIKLAAFYTILNNLYPEKEEAIDRGYSSAQAPYEEYVPQFRSDSEFLTIE